MNYLAKAINTNPIKRRKNGTIRIPLYFATTKRIPGNHITAPTFDENANP